MFWLSGVVCVGVMGRQWTILCYTSLGWLSCRVLFFVPSGFIGVTVSGYGASVWMMELAWEAFFGCLEFNPIVLNVERERNRRTFMDLESFESSLLGLFANLFFNWSHAWGFTTSNSIADFIDSLCLGHTAHSL
jgi:hypothetical protein